MTGAPPERCTGSTEWLRGAAAGRGRAGPTFGLGEAVELARALGRLPARVELYAIEGACFELGDPMGAAVQGAVVLVARELAERFADLPARA